MTRLLLTPLLFFIAGLNFALVVVGIIEHVPYLPQLLGCVVALVLGISRWRQGV